jgi:fructose/tagatose bisphosphate aldolase
MTNLLPPESFMTVCDSARDLFERLNGAVRLNADRTLAITDADRFRNELIDVLVATAVFSQDASAREAARWLIWEGAHAMGAHSASIQGLYAARGRGKTPNDFTVPAVNIRGMTYDFARAMFRAAHALDVGAFVFEIAKSEMGYTDQRPAEYATCIMAAAVKERHHGPVFIQGDHFQFNAKNYGQDPEKEAQGIRDLVVEAIAAGFYNIDIDSSTLVDLSFPTLDEQQKHNYERAAEMTAWVRKHEPAGLTISVGGEIGEVGHKNSTVEELRAYMDGYNRALHGYGDGITPISKVSVQTGTSHGGLPTADGKVAEVKLDFQVLEDLSREAREQYGMAGAVQHGASTLPDDLFHHFPERGTAEIHLATGFQNLLYDGGFLPPALLEEMFEWLRKNCADERTAGQTEEQFLYKTRKKAYGPFKRRLWELVEEKDRYMAALQQKLEFLFDKLHMRGTRAMVEQNVKTVLVHRPLPEGAAPALGQTAGAR